jgi:hypothetical protein
MSIYKDFKNYGNKVANYNSLSKRFDQPTYMSFRLEFGSGNDFFNNAAGGGLNYDRMPHPLFAPEGEKDVRDRTTYSTIDYLNDSNEITRAKMMKEFIIKFKQLQDKFQYYFQEVSGVEDLLKINPKKGQRIPSDKRLVIKMLEGIDLRVSHLMNLYKKIAWDDTYQRWVLPDMMRYFTLNIYVSEFRTFHTPNQYDGMGNANKTDLNDGNLYLYILDDILPCWVIKCEMCEFDLENIGFNYLSKLSVAEDPAEAGITLSIKVGKIYEEQTYPIFSNMYLIDKALNGFDRSNSEDNFDSTEQSANNKSKYSYNLAISQDTYSQETKHQTGKSFNEQDWLPSEMRNQRLDATVQDSILSKSFSKSKATDDNATIVMASAGWDNQFGTADDKFNVVAGNPTLPNTWVGNAMNTGVAFTKNLVKEQIDKAKITPIPGLGFSLSEAASAIQSKDIITAFGLIRKAIDKVTETDAGYPSDHLGGKENLVSMQDSVFREYLVNISKSEATDNPNDLVRTAALRVLSDAGLWERIKDFSKATDLIGQSEKNIQQNIENKDSLREIFSGQSVVEKIPLQRLILEGIPTSKATNGIII